MKFEIKTLNSFKASKAVHAAMNDKDFDDCEYSLIEQGKRINKNELRAFLGLNQLDDF